MFGPDDPLGERFFIHEEGSRNLFRGQAEHCPEGERDLGLAGQDRMTTGKDKPQTIVGLARRLLRQRSNQLELGSVGRLPAKLIQALPARRGQQPLGRPLGDAVMRPVLESLDDGSGHQLFRQVEVAKLADQARSKPARLLAKDALEQLVRLTAVSAHAR